MDFHRLVGRAFCFNLVVIPIRSMDSAENRCREDCSRLARKHGDSTWYIFGKTETHQVARFYTANFTQHIIRKTGKADNPEAFYLVDPALYPDFDGSETDSLLLETGQKIALMKINQH